MAEAKIDSIEYVPAALALRQRPAVPGVRSTFGTATELLNSIRLMFIRLGNHRCPNGHLLSPSVNVAAMRPLVCSVCGAVFDGLSAESFSFNGQGACHTCGGTGIVQAVDETTLVPDESLSIDEGAVAPWNSLMWSLMTNVCRAMGVRTDVPFSELTEQEREIVFHGPAEKKHILYKAKSSNQAGEMDFTYYNAVYTVENALAKVKDEKGMKRVEKFLKRNACPNCGGSRLNKRALSSLLCGKNLAEITKMTLSDLTAWIKTISASMPKELKTMAESICGQFLHVSKRLSDLGLDYITLDRAGTTLSTGERQRVQLARAVRNRTTGVLYVLDEPSIGLHPANVDGLLGVIDDLIAHGNSVILVDHDVRVLKAADWLIEMGPKAGEHGGQIVAQGTIKAVAKKTSSLIAGFLADKEKPVIRETATPEAMFAHGHIKLSTAPLHTVHALDLDIPKGRLIAVTGVSGSGKTTLILESLIPAIEAAIAKAPMPDHVKSVEVAGIERINLIDATPIGVNGRSTVATYSGILDDLRRLYAAIPEAKSKGYKVSDFSYNTGSLRCFGCDGTGQITMDVQFLPDVDIICPDCGGGRRWGEAEAIRYRSKKDKVNAPGISLPVLMGMTVEQALERLCDVKKVKEKLQILSDLGLDYLTLGEATPALSGGEAQRLKLAAEMEKAQDDAIFVFDEPTIGLHPLDVRILIGVFQKLVDAGATVIVIEHDLNMIANSDYVVDMGPGGGKAGGQIVATGLPKKIAETAESLTGKYLCEIIS